VGSQLRTVEVEQSSIERFQPLLDAERWHVLERTMRTFAQSMRGRVLWNINSTASGGGVAELLASLIPYDRGFEIDERWVVIEGSPDFFNLTKRLHNLLHGATGDGEQLSPQERAVYEETMRGNLERLSTMVRPGDVVVAHDPQVAGLVPSLVEQDVIAPAIDPFTVKNRDLSDEEVTEVLTAAGIARGSNGSAGQLHHRASLIGRAVGPDETLIVQVSRWDRLKDPAGVLESFARFVAPTSDATLILAGPGVSTVSDDPEQPEILNAVAAGRAGLPADVQERIQIAQLPMEDADENAAIVNALQRRAGIVVQKSLAEGFGLTVAEAMWKARPIVASRVGGIEDQIQNDVSGVLVDDPNDLATFGGLVSELLHDRVKARTLGEEARRRAISEYLAPRHLVQQAELILSLLG
jgi:trehalose synthase